MTNTVLDVKRRQSAVLVDRTAEMELSFNQKMNSFYSFRLIIKTTTLEPFLSRKLKKRGLVSFC